ncbi:MAG: hypothetical protein J0M02_01365 [Planctomycetes bacterium]|nr:hypothetical protein [Planctomycetota bacterium]
MQRRVSLEVAEQVLRDHIARTGDDLTPYSSISTPVSMPSGNRDFIDMDLVRDEMRMRTGRRASLNRAFRAQQWLAAEAFIAAQWPQHQSCTVPYTIVSGLDFDSLRPVAPGRRRR